LFSLKDKIILITGSTGYLGRAMSEGLAKMGAKVFINGRNKNSVNRTVDSLIKKGYQAKPAIFDITDYKQVKMFFSNFDEDVIDVLLINAYNGKGGTTSTSSKQDFRDSYEISMIATHNLFQNSLPYLQSAKKQNGDASVINITSMYGMVSPDQRIYKDIKSINPPFYGASKAALLQWTRYAACEFGPECIRVNSISPGAFPSLLVQENDPDFITRLSRKVPLGRVGIAAELKGPVLFLASEASSYVNGSNIIVDGGWTCW